MGPAHAQIALRGEIDELRLRGRPLLVLRGISRIEHLPVLVSRIVRDEVGWFLVRDHHDVVPRTALGARFAADADVVVDRHLECAERAGNRASRAADHTDRVAALIASGHDVPMLVAQPLADESRRAAVRLRAGAYTVVAPRAGVEIDQQDAFAMDQARVHRHLQLA